jgi:nitronate monooxygenase
MSQTLPPLKIGKHLARYPIVQGGMAVKVSGANLAGAVANAGGMGIISSAALGFKSPYFKKVSFFEANRLALIDQLQKARTISPNGIIGVNVLVATKDYLTLARTAAENGADLIVAGAGLPLTLPESTADYPDVALVPVVSSLQAAQTICQTWEKEYHRLPDAFVVENVKSIGGHLGAKTEEIYQQHYAIEYLIPALQDYLRDRLGKTIPLIATGGIWDRSDIDQMLALGASGVQIGTRFITTVECDADIRYKEFHLNARPEDVVIVPSPVGKPGRAIRNVFSERAIAGSSELEKRCVANCLQFCLCRDARETYCLLQALANASSGNLEHGLIFSGDKVGRAGRIIPVAELMAELINAQESLESHDG